MAALTRPNRRRRLDPAQRRGEILEAARGLLAERPLAEVSTADIAAAAGVTRALVHHYFGDAHAVYIELGVSMSRELDARPRWGPETPLPERIARNLAAYLDVVDQHRELWMAAVASLGNTMDEPVSALVEAAVDANIVRILEAMPDAIADTATARFTLRAYVSMNIATVRLWLLGRTSREAIELLLGSCLHDLVTRTLPALEAQATADAS